MNRQILIFLRENVKIPTYKPHTNHKRSSVSSHTLAPTTICDFSHSLCGSPLTDLGHINSHKCGHRKGIWTAPLILIVLKIYTLCNMVLLFFSGKFVNSSEGIIDFSSFYMYENKTYEVMVVVWKDTRHIKRQQYITIVNGDPPSAKLM